MGTDCTASLSKARRISAADSNKLKDEVYKVGLGTFCWQAVGSTRAVWQIVRTGCNDIQRERERERERERSAG